MTLRINTNKESLNSLGALQRNQGLLNKAFQRLSSGLRINSAADDAAGLAISQRFTSQVRGLTQAIRNASDGVSLTQTADAALGNSQDALQRIRELSVQAANGTLTDQDRQSIQAEVDQLTDELDRIGGTTTFNGKKLLDGSGGNQSFQVGANANETVSTPSIDVRASAIGRAAIVTSGQIDASGLQNGELSVNGIAIRGTTAADDTVSSTQNQGSAIAAARAINDSSFLTGVTASVNATEVSGGAVGGGQLDSSNTLTINGTAITSVDVNPDDAGDDLVDAINAATDETGVTASRNESGGIDLRAQDGRNIDVQTTGNAAAITGLSAGTTTGTVTLTSENQFSVGGTDTADAGLAAGLYGVRADSAASNIDVSTVDGANDALRTVDRALGEVSRARSRYGALQNRFESTISNLSNVAENATAANSRIADADYGQEAANLIRARIVGQANISVLAQANVSGQIALRLLGGG
ncbi:flagellin [Myxococcota bacterium]|nr:flagellin [Myxococcota bacterium]